MVDPYGDKVYMANYNSNNLSIIDTRKNTVIDKVNVGNKLLGVAISPDGSKVYVSNLVRVFSRYYRA